MWGVKHGVPRKIFAAVAAAVVAAAPWTWLPAFGGAVARHWLDLGEKGSSAVRVSVLSPFRLSARGVTLGALPGAPRIASVEARFTPWGLLRGRVSRLEASGAEWDLSCLVPEKLSPLFSGTGASGGLSLRWKKGVGYAGRVRGEVLGAPLGGAFGSDASLRRFDLSLRLAPATGAVHPLPTLRLEADGWRPERGEAPRPALSEGSVVDTNAAFRAEARLRADGTDLAVAAELSAGEGAFAADARIAPAAFSGGDALFAPFLAAMLPPDAPRASLSGLLEGKFSATRAKGAALPVWTAEMRLREGEVAAAFGEKDATLHGCGAFVKVDGFGPHVDVRPFGVRFKQAAFDRFALGDGSLWFRADSRSILLTEGRAGFCGGMVRVYALHLDFERLDAGFTLLLDDLDAGEVLSLFPQVDGTATGKMNGKLPLSVRQGAKIRLRDAFLHSPPGQIGRLRLRRASALVDRLRETGIPEETCHSLEEALEDLDYDVLRLDLSQDPKTGDGRLAVRLHGAAAASSGRAATPVDLNLVFNGQLEDSVNLGLRAAGIQPRK